MLHVVYIAVLAQLSFCFLILVPIIFTKGFIKPGPNGGVLEKTLTYRELDQETNRVARVIVGGSQKLQPGDRVVLVYPPSLDFMIAFLACLKAGVIAVPVFPPNPTRRDTLQMFCKIVEGCGAKVALTNTEYNYAKKVAGITQVFAKLKKGKAASPWPSDLEWILTDNGNAKADGSSSFTPHTPKPSDVAFLQYTSGKLAHIRTRVFSCNDSSIVYLTCSLDSP